MITRVIVYTMLFSSCASYLTTLDYGNIASSIAEKAMGTVSRAAKDFNPVDILLMRDTKSQPKEGEGGFDLPETASLEDCKEHFPQGQVFPIEKVSKWKKPVALCQKGFATIYSTELRMPLMTVERLSAQKLASGKGLKRYEFFYGDPRLNKADRVETTDLNRSGYGRGHLAPAGNQADADAMRQSFVMTNIIPQVPENNQGAWAKIEDDVRKYVSRAKGDVFVYTITSTRTDKRRVLPKSDITVPDMLTKVVYDQGRNRAWVYELENTKEARIKAPLSYAEALKVRKGLAVLPVAPESLAGGISGP
ncbi:NUC1 DNA/RNA endonuclease G, NUC1 [Comamonadaceae bacterium]